MERKIGLFGGSFNPIHIGHLIIASIFFDEFSLQKCYFIPNYLSPFKADKFKLDIDKQHRLNMLHSAILDDNRFAIETFEIDKNEISYSYLTISYFKEKFPNDELYLLVGDDQAIEFIKWKNWQFILENAYLVVGRRTSNINYKKDILSKIDANFHSRIKFLNNPLIEISSSSIRNMFALHKDCKYLLPKEVYKYILENGLYS
ncbi:MAG: nicotinate (nicotinamide) nucleotide adenylyltransferase [Candidatus Kapaibacteriales bacterium]